jgi:hypothetical protein
MELFFSDKDTGVTPNFFKKFKIVTNGFTVE